MQVELLKNPREAIVVLESALLQRGQSVAAAPVKWKLSRVWRKATE